jgi:hypothetical protein
MTAEPARPGRWPRRWWAIGIALLAGVALIAWWQFPEDSSTPAAIRPAALDYATRGFEEVSILGGARHEYPDRTGVVVRRTGCGKRIVWRPLEDRVTAYRLCGGRLRSIREVHRFFGRRDERVYRCAPGSSLRDGWRCAYDGTTEVARGGPVGTTRIAGAKAVHVHLDTTIGGDVEGTGTRDFWLRRPGGLPIRIAATNENTTGTPIGPVDYRESYDLRLLIGRLGAG